MIKVAVTGNIGSGKTEFIKFISKLGFCCISSDAIISKLYKDDRTRKIIFLVLLSLYNFEIIASDDIQQKPNFEINLINSVLPDPILPVTATLIIFYL